MSNAYGSEAAGGSPGPARRIVQFRARRRIEGVIKSPCNKDLAIGQQGRRVTVACCVEAASESPGPDRRIVQFRARGIRGAAF